MRTREIEEFFHGNLNALLSLVPREKRIETTEKLKEFWIPPDIYLKIVSGISISSSVIITALLSLQSLYLALGCGLMLFSIIYYVGLKLPDVIRSKYNRRMDVSVARALRLISTEQGIGIPFSKSIENASKVKGPAGKELKRVLRDVEKGLSFPEALNEMGERNDTTFVKRATNQLISLYSNGPENGSKALKKLASEQEAILRNEMQEYNQKLLFYSLLFIATSAIIPAMFQALVVIGSSFLDLNVGPFQALFIPAVVFPAVNISIFAYVTIKKP